MKVTPLAIPDVLLIEPKIFKDDRGFFMETFQAERYREHAGIDLPFVQDNFSRSYHGVLRGLHFQKKKPQGKLVRVASGKVFDVAVDLRLNSPTFQQWVGEELSEDNRHQMWIPQGFAHGFVVLSEFADFEYKCTNYYDPDDEACLLWNDPEVSIKWPVDNPILSPKDQSGVRLMELGL